MEKTKNDEPDADYRQTTHTKSIVILGLFALGVSAITFFLYNGLTSWAWLLYVVAFASGWSIVRIIIVFLSNPSEEPSTLTLILSMLVGAFIGMGLGQILRFQLIDIPNVSALRHETFSLPVDTYISWFFAPLQSDVLRFYLVLLAVGTFIGIIGLEWLVPLEKRKNKSTL